MSAYYTQEKYIDKQLDTRSICPILGWSNQINWKVWKSETQNTKKVTYEPARLQIFFKLRDKTNSEKERERDGKLGLLWEWVLVVCVGDSRTGGLCWAHGWSHPGSHVFGPRRPWGSHQVWSSSGSFTRRYCFSVSHSFFSYF